MDTLNFSAGVEKDNLSISLYGEKYVNDDEYLTSAFVAVTDLSEYNIFWISKQLCNLWFNCKLSVLI